MFVLHKKYVAVKQNPFRGPMQGAHEASKEEHTKFWPRHRETGGKLLWQRMQENIGFAVFLVPLNPSVHPLGGKGELSSGAGCSSIINAMRKSPVTEKTGHFQMY